MEKINHRQRKLLFMLLALPVTLFIGWMVTQIPQETEVTLSQSSIEIIAPVNAENTN